MWIDSGSDSQGKSQPNLDLTSDPELPNVEGRLSEYPRRPRPFVGIIFRCCGVYARIYKNSQGSAYEGHCPRCGRPARIRIAPDGIDAHFFEAL